MLKLIIVAVVVVLGYLFIADCQADQRECERRVPAYDHNLMDACKTHGPGVLDLDVND